MPVTEEHCGLATLLLCLGGCPLDKVQAVLVVQSAV